MSIDIYIYIYIYIIPCAATPVRVQLEGANMYAKPSGTAGCIRKYREEAELAQNSQKRKGTGIGWLRTGRSWQPAQTGRNWNLDRTNQ